MEEIDNKDIINYLKDNSKNWSSGNKEIDAFIQKNQSNVSDNIIFEWIPYNQFSDIKEIGYEFSTATWKNGPLHFNINKKKWERKSNRKVALKYLNMTKLYSIKIEFLNKFKSEGIGYGISQNNDTKDYIFVFHEKFYEKNFEKYCEKCSEGYTDEKYKWCKPCLIIHLNFTNWTSGNKMIDSFIQEEQLKIDTPWDTVFEWVPYNQFIDIEETNIQGFITAIWKDGPLKYSEYSKNYKRNLRKKFVLKFFYNSQNNPDEFLNKAESYLTTKDSYVNGNFYGISQNPDTKDYILIFGEKYLETFCKNCGENYTAKIYKWCKLCHINYLKSNFVDWTSKIKQAETFIAFLQEKQFEWIPYDQFSDIEDIKNIGATAKWNYITYNSDDSGDSDDSNDSVDSLIFNRKVVLKYLYNLQYISNEFLSKIKSKDITRIYGISQNPKTKNYALVFNKKYLETCCKNCGTNVIVTLKFFYNSQNVSIEFLNKIKQKGLSKYERKCKTVTLKYLYNILDILDEFLDKIKPKDIVSYGMSQNPDTKDYILMKSHLTEGIISYGISQNPNTKDYILVFCEKYIEKCCKNCGEKYTNEIYKWCKLLCSINEKSMKIFDFIDDFKFNWVPYNEFNDIKEMGRGGFSTVYSAIWRYKKVALKCLHNSHNFINEFLNEVKAYRAYSSEDIIKIYGISQNPDTGDFIMILECAEGGNFNATGKQPFSDRAHDKLLALDICNEIRPEINEPKAPKCYIDLMKKCWNSNPTNRPNVFKIEEFIWLFYNSYISNASKFKYIMKIEKEQQHYEIEKQFKEAEEYRKENPISIKDIQSTTHPQAVYTSRLLNSFTKDLPSECFDCAIDDL
ncbi:kinase-like domain-containing protein [Rhizophagus irregularis DAOM 181602=DAOM 197198]|nr:kinase-like domain-containing protein [Rhizophagus irregularis DAOM 181602=DAOM 197198]